MHRLNRQQLERVVTVGRSLVGVQDPDEVLRQVLTAARDLIGSRYAAIGVLDSEGRELERFLYIGIDEETRREIGPLPRGRGILGELIRNPEPLRVARIGEHPRSYGFPAGHPPMGSFLGVPLRIRDQVYGNVYLTEKVEGEEFTADDEHLLVVLGEWASIAIENARALESARKRRQEVERVGRGLEATARLGRELGGETRIERVLELVVKRARDLLDARVCVCFIRESADVLRVADAAGDIPSDLIGKDVRADSAVGAALAEPVDVADLGPRGRASLGVSANAGLLMPLRARGEQVGILAVLDPGSPTASASDVSLTLEAFAASAAAAIAGTRRIEDERLRLSIRSAELERQRWARELHDEALQELGASQVALESALAMDDVDQVKAIVTNARDQTERSIASLRELIAHLRPASLDQLGIGPALETLAERTTARGGVDVQLTIDLAYENGDETTRLDTDLESAMYRVLQEALSNVVKHSDADRAVVSVVERGERVTITVEDDGKGFAEGGASNGSFGLIGMRERVELLHGELAVEGRPGHGTRVHADFPVVRAGDASQLD